MSFLWHGLTEQGAQVPIQVDAQGRVIAVDGSPEASLWERTGTTLSPAVPGDSVTVGDKITLDADGNVLLGTSVPIPTAFGIQGLLQVHGASAQTSGAQIGNYGISDGGPGLYFSKSRSGTVGTKTIVEDGDNIGSLIFSGADGTNFIPGAGIQALVDGTPGINAMPGRLVFNTTAAGASFPTQRMSINGAGNVQIGGTDALPSIRLNADGTAAFTGNITAPNITFRSADPSFYALDDSRGLYDSKTYIGPELDLLEELVRLEALVKHLYEVLRQVPPAGWEVWDGNTDLTISRGRHTHK